MIVLTQIRKLALLVFFSAIGTAACVSPSAGGALPPRGDPSPGSSQTASAPAIDPTPVLSLAPVTPDDAWAMLIPGDPASISYPSLAELARDADAVVIASPGALVKGPDFTDEYGNVIHLATLTLNVERLIRGSIKTRQPGTLALWISLGVGDPGGYDYAEYFARLLDAKPSGRAIFHLKNMAAWNEKMGGPADHPQADPYAYQILGGQGFLRDVNARIEPPALSPDTLATMAGTWQSDLRGRPFAEVVQSLDRIAKLNP